MGVHCRGCDARYATPRPLCPKCFGADMEWIEFSGLGELLGFTVVHVAPTHMAAQGHGRENPYCVGIVRLNEGPTIAAQILDADVARPENLRVGTFLRATFVRRKSGDQERAILAFRRVT